MASRCIPQIYDLSPRSEEVCHCLSVANFRWLRKRVVYLWNTPTSRGSYDIYYGDVMLGYTAGYLTMKTTYGTAQRQLDTHTLAAGWKSRVKITSCVQYLNRHPLRSCLHQANCLACHAPANVTLILNELFSKTYNINSIYTMKLQFLSLYVPIKHWIHCPTEKLFVCSISCPTSWLDVENGFDTKNESFIGDWISINLFAFLQSVGWKVRKYFISYVANIVCQCLTHHNLWTKKLVLLKKTTLLVVSISKQGMAIQASQLHTVWAKKRC